MKNHLSGKRVNQELARWNPPKGSDIRNDEKTAPTEVIGCIVAEDRQGRMEILIVYQKPAPLEIAMKKITARVLSLVALLALAVGIAFASPGMACCTHGQPMACCTHGQQMACCR